MQKLEVMRSKWMTVWCYPGLRLIHHEIHGFCASDRFREALLAGTRAMGAHGAEGWLSDDRRNGPLSPEDEEWGKHVWFPRARAAGFRVWAMVLPQSAAGKLNIRRQVEHYRSLGVMAQMFSEVECAVGWINRAISGSVWPPPLMASHGVATARTG